jgi:tryptophan synthase beta chain
MGKWFGEFGGQYVPEVLKPALEELAEAAGSILPSPGFRSRYSGLLDEYVGRPTPLYFAERLTASLGGAEIYIKLEGLANTGAHKINNALGQALLAREMGKRRVIAETGAGQHGVAVAAAAAKLGLACRVFMGEVDVERQQPNVFLMRQFGAEVTPVRDGTKTLKDAVNAALKEWVTDPDTTAYILGSALGPYPYPDMVRTFQRVIGDETRRQILERAGRLPNEIFACCGGGSNAIGMFTAFLEDPVSLTAVEAGGRGSRPGEHAMRMNGRGNLGIVEGYKSYFLQDEDGQIQPTHSISAGLDYAGIGPQLAELGRQGRIGFTSASDDEVLAAFGKIAVSEGLVFALESAHAAAAAFRKVPEMDKKSLIIIHMSGRGDKDLFITAGELYREPWTAFLRQEVSRLERKDGSTA